MGKLFPSLISGNLICLQQTITELEPVCDGFHVDVMDFSFVDNTTFGPDIVNAIRKLCTKRLWIHLMVTEPERYLERFSLNSCDIVSVHSEVLCKPDIFITIKKRGLIPSIAISPETPLEKLLPFLPYVEHILVMSVHPGFSGQLFLPHTFERLEQLQQLISQQKQKHTLGIDGGVTEKLIPQLLNLGIQDFAIASALFANKNPLHSAKKIKELLT